MKRILTICGLPILLLCCAWGWGGRWPINESTTKYAAGWMYGDLYSNAWLRARAVKQDTATAVTNMTACFLASVSNRVFTGQFLASLDSVIEHLRPYYLLKYYTIDAGANTYSAWWFQNPYDGTNFPSGYPTLTKLDQFYYYDLGKVWGGDIETNHWGLLTNDDLGCGYLLASNVQQWIPIMEVVYTGEGPFGGWVQRGRDLGEDWSAFPAAYYYKGEFHGTCYFDDDARPVWLYRPGGTNAFSTITWNNMIAPFWSNHPSLGYEKQIVDWRHAIYPGTYGTYTETISAPTQDATHPIVYHGPLSLLGNLFDWKSPPGPSVPANTGDTLSLVWTNRMTFYADSNYIYEATTRYGEERPWWNVLRTHALNARYRALLSYRDAMWSDWAVVSNYVTGSSGSTQYWGSANWSECGVYDEDGYDGIYPPSSDVCTNWVEAHCPSLPTIYWPSPVGGTEIAGTNPPMVSVSGNAYLFLIQYADYEGNYTNIEESTCSLLWDEFSFGDRYSGPMWLGIEHVYSETSTASWSSTSVEAIVVASNLPSEVSASVWLHASTDFDTTYSSPQYYTHPSLVRSGTKGLGDTNITFASVGVQDIGGGPPSTAYHFSAPSCQQSIDDGDELYCDDGFYAWDVTEARCCGDTCLTNTQRIWHHDWANYYDDIWWQAYTNELGCENPVSSGGTNAVLCSSPSSVDVGEWMWWYEETSLNQSIGPTYNVSLGPVIVRFNFP